MWETVVPALSVLAAEAVIPFFRRIIWNVADLSVFAGCLMAIGVLACEAV